MIKHFEYRVFMIRNQHYKLSKAVKKMAMKCKNVRNNYKDQHKAIQFKV